VQTIEYTRVTYKYQLRKTLVHELTTPILTAGISVGNDFVQLQDGVLTIKCGYAWDGASGPTIDTQSTMMASLIHDAGYQLMREGWLHWRYKELFDEELKQVMLQKGALPLRAGYYKAAVARYGHAAMAHEPKVLTA